MTWNDNMVSVKGEETIIDTLQSIASSLEKIAERLEKESAPKKKPKIETKEKDGA